MFDLIFDLIFDLMLCLRPYIISPLILVCKYLYVHIGQFVCVYVWTLVLCLPLCILLSEGELVMFVMRLSSERCNW